MVDDEHQLLKTTARLVESTGRVTCIQCDNGTDGLRHLLSDEELLGTFLDLKMPGVSGIDVLYQLRAHAPARLERLVISTGMRGYRATDEKLDEYRVPRTGEPIPVADKPYGIELVYDWIKRWSESGSPMGPRYELGHRLAEAIRHNERRDSPPPDYDAEENTGSLILRSSRDPKNPHHDDPTFKLIGDKIADTRATTRDHARIIEEHTSAIEKLEAHFEDQGEGRRGVVVEIRDEVRSLRIQRDAEKEADAKVEKATDKIDHRTFRWVPLAVTAILAALAFAASMGALRAKAAAPPPAPTIDYRALAKELAHVQQQEPKK